MNKGPLFLAAGDRNQEDKASLSALSGSVNPPTGRWA